MQKDYKRAREGNTNLSERLQKVKMENKALRGTAADFERVKRAFGPEEVERSRGGRKAPKSARAGAEESRAEVQP